MVPSRSARGHYINRARGGRGFRVRRVEIGQCTLLRKAPRAEGSRVRFRQHTTVLP